MLNQQAVRRLNQANGISNAPMHELCLHEPTPMNTKPLSMTLGLVAAITVSVWLLSQNAAVDSSDRSDQDAAVSDFQAESSSSGSASIPAERKAPLVYGQQQAPAPDMPSNPEFDYRQLFPEDIEDQIAEWNLAHGKSKERLAEYEAFELDALLAMGEQGDIYALQAAAQKLFSTGEDKHSFELLSEAAIQGSTQSLLNAAAQMSALHGQVIGNDARGLDGHAADFAILKTGSPDESARITIIAMISAAAIRGDVQSAAFALRFANPKAAGKPFARKEFEAGFELGAALIESFNQSRKNRGMDEFASETTPAIVWLGGVSKEDIAEYLWDIAN